MSKKHYTRIEGPKKPPPIDPDPTEKRHLTGAGDPHLAEKIAAANQDKQKKE
jgi:hypothetical protein